MTKDIQQNDEDHIEIATAFLAKAVETTREVYRLDDKGTEKILLGLLAAFSKASEPTNVVSQIPPPVTAPEQWSQRDHSRRENPADFVRRVYEPWLGKGLTRKTLKDLDSDLYRALAVWQHRHPDDEIAHLKKKSDVTNDMIEVLTRFFPPDELRKLGGALYSRQRRSKSAQAEPATG